MTDTTRTFRVTREVAADPATVWAVLADYGRDHEWRDGVRMRQEPPGLATTGARTFEQMTFLGSEHRVVARLEEVVEHRLIRFRAVESETPVHGERTLEPTENGTRVSIRIAMEPQGVYRLFAAPMTALLRRRFERDLARLAALVETKTS